MDRKAPEYGHSPRRANSRPRPDMTDRRNSPVDGSAYVDAIYRLRFVLGPTIPPEVLEWNRRQLEEERVHLLAQGVSPGLLGSVD